MELRQLESFKILVEQKSFTKAAAQLFISQPTISAHIRSLEEELKTRLVLRTTKSITITPHGMELYQCACKILDLKEGLVRSYQQDRSTIRLGVSTIPADYILPELLPAYGLQQPQVSFHIHQSDSQGIVEGLLNGSLTLGLIGMEPANENICAVPFYEDHMVLIAPAALDLKGRSPWQLLEQQPILLREQGSGSRKWLEAYLESKGVAEGGLHVIARLNDQESIKKLVAKGMGISIISEKAALEAPPDSLQLVALPDSGSRSLYLAYHRDYIFQEPVLDFIAFVKNFYVK